ncbi:putative lipid II flippase FtsW [Candidatus Dependentiae bacterium]|nr:putative lipid II flippase FtsW [Candidatus Dependentiae bacterium]
MALIEKKIKYDLQFLFLIVFSLTTLGLIFIYSSSSVYALEKFGSANFFLKKQFLFLIPAFIGFLFFAIFPFQLIKKYSPFFFIGSLILTASTLIPFLGLKLHGSSRWLLGSSFQPSELLKFFLIIYMGFFLEKKQKRIRSFWHSYLPFLLILSITFLILLKQPDFGAVVTIFITSVLLLFVAEFKLKYLILTILAALPIGFFLIFSKSYRLNRILIFLNPWQDPQGRGFQIIQSLIAIGSGGLWGIGVSNSKQKFFYLPMQHTDFIFSIIAEETGFVGSCLIILLYFLFCYFGLKIALQLDNPFAFFTTLGFVILISLQATINLMVTSGLLPTKGLGLPFVSYGGSSLVCFFCMIGLISNFVRQKNF